MSDDYGHYDNGQIPNHGGMSEKEAKLARLQYLWRSRDIRKPLIEADSKYLNDRGLSDATIIASDIYRAEGYHVAALLGRKSFTSPAFVFPIRDIRGEVVSVIARPDFPRIDDNGKKVKFEMPYGIPRPGLIFALNAVQRLKDPTTPYVIITEGFTRAAVFDQFGKCAFGLLGVTGWNKPKTKILNKDIQICLPWIKKIGRVLIAFDSDARHNDSVMAEATKLAIALRKEGVVVVFVFPPEREIGEKIAWDDVIARDGIAVFDQAVAKALEEPEERPRIAESDTYDLANWFLADPETPRLVYYSGSFWGWDAEHSHYSEIESQQLENLFRRWANPRYSHVSSWIVREVFAQLREITAAPSDAEPPFWIGAVPGNFADVDMRMECVVLQNLTLHLPLQSDGTRHTHPPTPDLFCTHALDVVWDPDAPKPKRFLRFLDEAFGDNEEAKLLLQEIFGYLLTPDTSRQKIFVLVGASGTGKGVIVRLIEMLLGKDNVVPTTLKTLGESFGLHTLIGKALAVLNEIRLCSRTNTNEALNTLLNISGEDDVIINRKNRDHVKARLSARILMTCNEAPILADSAGALRRRLVVLSMNQVCKNPDNDLDKKLREELTGISNWAIAGSDRLRRNGGFTQLTIGEDEISLVDQIVDAGSPIKSFVEDCCVIGDWCEAIDDLYACYKNWALSDNETSVSKSRFINSMKAACPSISQKRPRTDGGPRPFLFYGIKLNAKGEHWRTPTHIAIDANKF